MPFAPKIRKDILAALDDYIIPALRRDVVTQLIAEPPFDFGDVEHRVLQKKFLEEKEFAPFQSIVNWKRQYLMATRFLRLMVVFDGTCIEHVGITQNMVSFPAAERKTHGGVMELILRAPVVLCHPPFMLHSSGQSPHQSFIDYGKVLYCNIVQNGVRISLNVRREQGGYASHNLEIDDISLAQIGHFYVDELRAGDKAGAQAQLLAFMLRLRRYLSTHRAFISNSCWVTPPDIAPQAAKVLSAANLQICQQLTEHIVSHLHAPLSLSSLSERFQVSDVHLNQIFKQTQGTTVMNFVTRMRIEAAKTIIAQTPERISDVAQLVGFASDTGFTNTFRRITGISPREYRKKMNR